MQFEIEMAIREEVAKAISDLCKCDYPADFIKTGQFSQRSSLTHITYRSTLVGTDAHTAGELLECLEKWVESSAALKIKLFVLDVDSTCPVRISSLKDPECAPISTPASGRTLVGRDLTCQCFA